ncbi:hypothetical protein Ctob_004508 [Chrysochromulina tobinii]|uniref:Ubiquitin-like protease family profile domain-containing protein n=1 Tax=Chrysochromulina tobinii TaxID=1460289 RepID=A0A0M0JE92_9EUKA|nr:hypothetical protein Ctob_004508 [Chrysochromulina tobinii]|eukprot:KOO24919.1 hypothetical protein Ctob_004508 [Chrysochromulina sp. CCMP291]
MPSKRKARADPISIDLCNTDDEDDGTAAVAAAVDATKPAAGRRSSRIASQARKPDEAVLLHFPSEDAKERITLTYADVRRLKSGARGAAPETLLLSDNLVDLYIKYLSGPPQQLCAKFIPGLDEKSRSHVHMFSAFFLKRLKTTITKGLSMHTMMKWNENKVLFTHLRAFLEFYWARQFESRPIEGYPRSGRPLADEPLPPPNEPPCVPPPQPPTRPKRVRYGASSSDVATRRAASLSTAEVLGRRRASRGVGGAASEPIDADACADPLVDALDGENSSLSGGRPLRRAAKQSMQRIEWLKSDEEAWREVDRQQEGRGVRQRRSTATARTEAMEEADAKKARREFEAREATKSDRQVARLRRGDSAPVASSTTVPAMAPREATGDAQALAMAPREATVGDAQAADEAEDVVLLMVAEEGPTVEAMVAAEEGAADQDTVGAQVGAPKDHLEVEEETWFSTERMPNIILKKVPQQKNDYDCGLYMLTFIEQLAAAEELPSFETADGLIAHFSGATLPKQEAIDEKRANFYKGVFKLAEAQSQPDDPIVHSDWDGEELEEPRPGKRQRGGRAGALAGDGAGGTGDPAVPVVTSVE